MIATFFMICFSLISVVLTVVALIALGTINKYTTDEESAFEEIKKLINASSKEKTKVLIVIYLLLIPGINLIIATVSIIKHIIITFK